MTKLHEENIDPKVYNVINEEARKKVYNLL